jgi:hypothetical protein
MSFGGDDRIQRIILALGIEGEEIGDRVVQIIRDLIAAQDDAKRSAIELATAATAGADARRAAAQGTRELAQAQKELGQQFDAELQAFVTSTLATHQSEEALRSQARAADAAVRSEQALAEALDLMAEHEATATRAVIAGADAHAKSAGAADKSAQQMTAWTRTVFFAAQGIEDLQYSFSAVVNNLPMIGMSIAQALGGTPALGMQIGAAVSFIGVAINQLLPKIRELWHEFNSEKFNEVGQSIGNVETRLKELKEKSWKVGVDYEEINKLEEKILQMKANMAALQGAQTGLTETQQEMGKRVREAVIEKAGQGDEATGAGNIIRALTEAVTPADVQKVAAAPADVRMVLGDQRFAKFEDARKRLMNARQRMMQPLSDEDFQAAQVNAEFAQKEIDKFNNEIRQSLGQSVLGSALRGNERWRAFIQRTFEQNRAIFARQGVGAEFGPAIAKAERGLVQFDVEHEKEIPALKEQAEEHRKIIKENKELREQGARNIREDAEEKAREQKRVDDETARIAHGAQQKAVQDAEKADAARQREVKKTADARQRQVERLARENLPVAEGGAGQLREAVAAKVGMQMPEEQIYRQLIPQVAQRLRSRPTTIPPQMIAEVARQMVADEVAKVVPQVGAVGAGAVIGQQEQKNQAAMNRQMQQMTRAQQAMMERGLAQQLMQPVGPLGAGGPGGLAPQRAVAVAHQTLQHMKHQMNFDEALLKSYVDVSNEVMNLNRQVQNLRLQHTRQRRRFNLLNRGGPAG